MATAWRLNGAGYQDFAFRHGEAAHDVRAYPGADGGFSMEVAGARVEIERAEGAILVIDGVRRRVSVSRQGAMLFVLLEGAEWRLTPRESAGGESLEAQGGDRLIAPMPGRIVSIHAAPGDKVAASSVILVLEAMKVQIRLAAPRDCFVSAVAVQAGDLVDEGAELARFGETPSG
jgi:3-methylcrotonyl-CoA carboxylase alpha subunit